MRIKDQTHHNNLIGTINQEIDSSKTETVQLKQQLKIKTIELAGNRITKIPQTIKDFDLIAWEGPLGEYCALIKESDIHIGYDSSNQHIAAATGTPTIDIFVNKNTPMIEKRWTPGWCSQVKTIKAY